jgi:hypothetical protein
MITIQIQIAQGQPKAGVSLNREIGKWLLSGGLLESSDGTKVITVDVQTVAQSGWPKT